MKIKMLNNETINKIAAGEVIIRPVSVIKELVENAIDAGADRITVAVEKGGKTSICITDNGTGIAYNDVPLAFKRHATSKILTIDDLEQIESLGFRGEALSSIAAVGKVRITTRETQEEIGSQSYFEGGSLINQRVCTYDSGTEIRVSDLFYNTPARQKHLQKDKNEEKIVRDMMEKLVLSHPEISFTYRSDGREVFKTPGTGHLKDVVESLFGRDYFSGLREMQVDNSPMHLSGYISDLTLTRATKEEQIFFINGRYVKNKGLSKAFEAAYEGYLMQHRHPVGIVFITLPGRMLDVNIHPAKTEIQILNESLVTILFKQGVKDTLKNQDLIVPIENVTKEEIPEEKAEPREEVVEPVTFFEETSTHFELPEEVKISAPKKEAPPKEPEPQISAPAPKPEKKEEKRVSEVPRIAEAEPVYPREKVQGPDFAHAKIIGQLFSTYILLEKGDEILMLDQHAAHEAFLYEELRERFESGEAFPAQTLMIPQTLDISVKEAGDFENIKAELSRYGFDCDLFGETALVVRSVPVILGEPQDTTLLRAFMEARVYSDVKTPRDEIEKIITMSCKKAVKGHQNLTEEEIRGILDGLSRLDNPYTCPHGRPIILKLKEYELKKLFKRVV